MRPRLVLLACATLLAVPATAAAAGGPVGAVQGGPGVAAPGGHVRFVAVAGAGGTVIERIRIAGGQVQAVRRLAGDYGIPGAAYDGSTTGLSADGGTLVVAPTLVNRIPKRTRLYVLDTAPLRVRSRVDLPGYSSVDAISPDGRWLYLIRYKPDFVGYAVRTYDLARDRLLRAPVVDPREPDEKMQGLPMTRTSSADGRWAYTLYMRPSGKPFVHALDTERRTAACIDLPSLTGSDLSGERLALRDGGTTLAVLSPAGDQALVDTRTFAVRRPGVAAATAPAPRRAAQDGGGLPPAPVLAAGLAVLAAAALALGWRRRALGS